jgi:hypothetical protein
VTLKSAADTQPLSGKYDAAVSKRAWARCRSLYREIRWNRVKREALETSEKRENLFNMKQFKENQLIICLSSFLEGDNFFSFLPFFFLTKSLFKEEDLEKFFN